MVISLSQKRGKDWKGTLWVHDTLILEIIFVISTEDSSFISNDTRNLSNIRTTGNSCGTQLHETKTTPLFLTANGEASWSLLSSLISLLSGGKMQPEKSYCCILKVTGQIWVSKKRISINIDHSYHQRSSFWISLNWPMIQTQF